MISWVPFCVKGQELATLEHINLHDVDFHLDDADGDEDAPLWGVDDETIDGHVSHVQSIYCGAWKHVCPN